MGTSCELLVMEPMVSVLDVSVGNGVFGEEANVKLEMAVPAPSHVRSVVPLPRDSLMRDFLPPFVS